jgi:hypothetical protein
MPVIASFPLLLEAFVQSDTNCSGDDLIADFGLSQVLYDLHASA